MLFYKHSFNMKNSVTEDEVSKCIVYNPEAVVRSCSVEKVFLEISSNSQ